MNGWHIACDLSPISSNAECPGTRRTFRTALGTEHSGAPPSRDILLFYAPITLLLAGSNMRTCDRTNLLQIDSDQFPAPKALSRVLHQRIIAHIVKQSRPFYDEREDFLASSLRRKDRAFARGKQFRCFFIYAVSCGHGYATRPQFAFWEKRHDYQIMMWP
jgi:hypothetical protein